MDGQGLSEAEAYESIRRQAMAKRLSMDDMAAAIIHANELLQYRAKDVLVLCLTTLETKFLSWFSPDHQ